MLELCLKSDCSIRKINAVSVLLEYIDLFNIFYQTLPISTMLELCSMLLGTYYAQNYAGIIGASLVASEKYTTIQHRVGVAPPLFVVRFKQYIRSYRVLSGFVVKCKVKNTRVLYMYVVCPHADSELCTCKVNALIECLVAVLKVYQF